jgi:hypothetical protein
MVLYSDEAKEDLRNILWGLANWKKHPLGHEHAMQYVDDIQAEADKIDKLYHHFDAHYPIHLLYGHKVHNYRRNRNTVWYMIYDWDAIDRIAYLNKIMNNYQTI